MCSFSAVAVLDLFYDIHNAKNVCSIEKRKMKKETLNITNELEFTDFGKISRFSKQIAQLTIRAMMITMHAQAAHVTTIAMMVNAQTFAI